MADDMLQQAAAYSPGVGSRLLNLATGGLFGYVSGQQQKEQEAEWARRAMAQEQMLRERMRAMREQAVLEDIATERRRAEQAAQSGLGAAFAYSGAPTDEAQMTPFFGAGYRGAQAKTAEQEAEDRRNTPQYRAIIEQYGETAPQNATPAQLKAQAQFLTMSGPQRVAQRYSQQQDVADATALGLPVSQGPGIELAQQAAEARAGMLQRKEAGTRFAMEEAAKRERIALMQAAKTKEDVADVWPRLTPNEQKVFREKAIEVGGMDYAPELPQTVRKELDAKINQLDKANRLLGTIDKFAQGRPMENLSALTFNSLRQAVLARKSPLFGSDAERMMANDIVQQFEQLASGERKQLFGASLTANELASANRLFANPNSADFLPRAVAFIEGLFSQNPVENYSQTYRGTESYSKLYNNKFGEFEKVRPRIFGRSTLERFQQTGVQPAGTNAPMQLKGGMEIVPNGRGGFTIRSSTNAPASR